MRQHVTVNWLERNCCSNARLNSGFFTYSVEARGKRIVDGFNEPPLITYSIRYNEGSLYIGESTKHILYVKGLLRTWIAFLRCEAGKSTEYGCRKRGDVTATAKTKVVGSSCSKHKKQRIKKGWRSSSMNAGKWNGIEK